MLFNLSVLLVVFLSPIKNILAWMCVCVFSFVYACVQSTFVFIHFVFIYTILIYGVNEDDKIVLFAWTLQLIIIFNQKNAEFGSFCFCFCSFHWSIFKDWTEWKWLIFLVWFQIWSWTRSVTFSLDCFIHLKKNKSTCLWHRIWFSRGFQCGETFYFKFFFMKKCENITALNICWYDFPKTQQTIPIHFLKLFIFCFSSKNWMNPCGKM